ncbi:thioesterase II family protein [Streptomyces olivaceoviridis]|uniref:thioesterase II family protein n=1 Tax=Streptomyces olivaceoviridis TaxID=1921 RepID=UPI0036FE86F2
MGHDDGQASGHLFHAGPQRPDATVRLYLFPHAGGSAASYARWASLLPHDVEVRTTQLPGRQERRSETAFTRLDPLIEALYDEVEDDWDGRPFAFFGHSMGALLSYRLTLAMEAEGGPSPALLAVSGWAGVAHHSSDVPIADMSDEEFIAKVEQFGGLPPEVLDNPEMRALVLPALRADFQVLNDYRHDAAPVRCPLVAYCGLSDPALAGDAMATWSSLSPAFLGLTRFPGSHFYIYQHASAIAADLGRHLRASAAKS